LVGSAAPRLYAHIHDVRLSGVLIEPFESFVVEIELNTEDDSIKHFDVLIDDRSVEVSSSILEDVSGIDLHTLVVTHDANHVPNARELRIVGYPATLTVGFRYTGNTSCASEIGEIRVNMRIDTLESTVSSYCFDESNA
jgi:hypothetical protein